MSSSGPRLPQRPLAVPGLPEPVKTLRATAGGVDGQLDEYPICWSSDGSAGRTKQPILDAIQPLLDSIKAASATPRVLEIASGLGEHILHYASSNPEITFQPSEVEPHLIARITQASEAQANVASAVQLNALSSDDWEGVRSSLGGTSFDGVVIQNLLHIAPAQVTTAIFEHLSPLASPPLLATEHGFISIAGTFVNNGTYFSEDDKTFDEHIRGLSPFLGLRDITRFVVPEAERFGFELVDRKSVPKGNWVLVFKPKRG